MSLEQQQLAIAKFDEEEEAARVALKGRAPPRLNERLRTALLEERRRKAPFAHMVLGGSAAALKTASSTVRRRAALFPTRTVATLLQRLGVGVFSTAPGVSGGIDPAVEPFGVFIPPAGQAVDFRGRFKVSAGAADAKSMLELIAQSAGLADETTPSALAAGTFSIAPSGAGGFRGVAEAVRARVANTASRALLVAGGGEDGHAAVQLQRGLDQLSTHSSLQFDPSKGLNGPGAELGGTLAASAATRKRRASLGKLSVFSNAPVTFKTLAELETARARGDDVTEAAAKLPPMSAAEADEAQTIDLNGDFFEYLGKTVPERVRAIGAAKLALSTWPWPRKMRDWRVADVGAWLRAIGLERYVPAFEEAGVDGDSLLSMDAKDIRDTMCMADIAHLSIALHAREDIRIADIEGDAGRGLLAANVVVLTGSNAGRFGPAAKMLSGLLKEDFVIPKPAVVFTATANGFSRRVELAVRSGFPVDSRDADGNTLAIIAAKHGHRILLQMLLNNGADVNAKNKQGACARRERLLREGARSKDGDGVRD